MTDDNDIKVSRLETSLAAIADALARPLAGMSDNESAAYAVGFINGRTAQSALAIEGLISDYDRKLAELKSELDAAYKGPANTDTRNRIARIEAQVEQLSEILEALHETMRTWLRHVLPKVLPELLAGHLRTALASAEPTKAEPEPEPLGELLADLPESLRAAALRLARELAEATGDCGDPECPVHGKSGSGEPTEPTKH